MAIDQVSLFFAAGICAGALGLTMLSAWLHNRADTFLFGWTMGMLLLGGGAILYYSFPADRLEIVAAAVGLETVGFIIVLLSARTFVGKATPRSLSAGLLLLLVPTLGPIAYGLDGLGMMNFNFIAGFLLAITGIQYWTARTEARPSIMAITTLYLLAALSFFACGTIIAHEGMWVMGVHPDNWAETFNAIMCIAGITGIGALSLGLNNARAARRHRTEAQTDALTGLLNRRALFESLSGKELPEGHAVVAFDLDHFKSVNDRYGYAAGDALLQRFAAALRQNLRDGDLIARTGGEEFVLVLRPASLQIATSTAERIRAIFAASFVETSRGAVSGTASAGVAVSSGEPFEDVLHRADTTLYRAKDGGRNRVAAALQVVA